MNENTNKKQQLFFFHTRVKCKKITRNILILLLHYNLHYFYEIFLKDYYTIVIRL